MLSIGKRIRNARIKANLKQRELAELIHVSQSYVCDIEHDRFNPSVSTLKTIANALHVDVAEIIGDINTMKETGITNDELHWLMVYRNLNEDDKKLAQAMMQRFVVPIKSVKSINMPITGKVNQKIKRKGLVSGRV